MSCSVDAKGSFEGFYDKTGTKIVDSAKYTIIEGEPGQASAPFKLEIKDIVESDYGEYKCKDTVSEDAATLEVTGKNYFLYTVDDSLSLTC